MGAKYLQIFKKNNAHTVGDLLMHFPALYIDTTNPSEQITIGVKKLYRAKIINFGLTRNFRRRLSILTVNATVGEDKVRLVFFNQHYLAEFFKDKEEVVFYGAFEMRNGSCQTNTPLVFTDLSTEAVIPMYNKIGTIKSGTLKKIIGNCLDTLEDDFEFLPRSILERHGFPGITEGLKALHRPQHYDPGEIHGLKQRFIYGEFFSFQLELQFIRNFFRKVPRVHRYALDEASLAEVRKPVPFTLTADQEQACQDIWNDLGKDVTMQRLLQGDVGSGKTVVAFMALLTAVRSGYQGAMLAPTEILARQHFTNAGGTASPAAKGAAPPPSKAPPTTKIEILTGSTSAKDRKRILQQLEAGEIDILFGTHALLNETVKFKNLSLVVIDEQHRFGVSQRAALYYKGNATDLLVTTATPIPRTMLLSLYNDLSVSTIKTMPHGRLPIITKRVEPDRRDAFYNWLRKKVEAGSKAYIILPLIEDSEFFTELRSIESETAYFKKVFKGLPLGIVSGRVSSEEKDEALNDFAAGKTRVLVSTTVIEVGIDVRDASYMVIENADRYGLSQLHQLRGRVGRGDIQSYCYLFASPNITENGEHRLETIVSTTDGFKIAETDLEMRGGGIISGLQQSGYLDFKVGNMQDDQDVFINARTDVAEILENKDLQNEYVTTFLHKIEEKLKDINFS